MSEPDSPISAERTDSGSDRAGGHRHDVVIIGAGLSGVCAAIKLAEAGIDDVRIFEKAADVGGTWRDNTYPGVACDVPSHLYSYSFAPNPDWSRWYAPGHEIHDYIRTCAQRFGVRDRITFETSIDSAVWRDDHWHLVDSNGDTCTARSVISALGGLHSPNVPSIANMDRFEGAMFHTSRWRHDVDLTGKRVAVVGTGATAVQVVPEIAEDVDHLYVFQRSPVWVGEKHDPEYSAEQRDEFRRNPSAMKNHRAELWHNFESLSIELHRAGTRVNEAAERRATEQIRRSVSDPDVADALTPDHNFACKRPTISTRYYQTFDRDNVTLVSGPVDALTPTGVRAGDDHVEVDVVVLATGFKPFDITNEIDITGTNGLELADAWKDRIESYRSIMVNGFPNLFLMMGPNGTGLQSALQSIEQQAIYAVGAIERMEREGIVAVDPRADRVKAFSRLVQDHFKKTTHGKGCSSWWTDEAGINHSIWPASTVEYRLLLSDIDLNDFEVTRGRTAPTDRAVT